METTTHTNSSLGQEETGTLSMGREDEVGALMEGVCKQWWWALNERHSDMTSFLYPLNASNQRTLFHTCVRSQLCGLEACSAIRARTAERRAS